MENKQPDNFCGIKVFASNPWQGVQKGFIRNLTIESVVQGMKGGFKGEGRSCVDTESERNFFLCFQTNHL